MAVWFAPIASAVAKMGIRATREQFLPAVETTLSDLLTDACQNLDRVLGCGIGDSFPSYFKTSAHRAAFVDLMLRVQLSGRSTELINGAALVNIDTEYWDFDPIQYLLHLSAELAARAEAAASTPTSKISNWHSVLYSSVLNDHVLEHRQLLKATAGDRPSGDPLEVGTSPSTDNPLPLADPEIYTTLANLYPHRPLMEFGGQPTSIWAIPAPTHELGVDEVLGQLNGDDPGAFSYLETYDPVGEDQHLAFAMQPVTATSFDGRLYCMETLDLAGRAGATLNCRRGRFFLAQTTSWSLYHELIETVAAIGPLVDVSHLPRRRWVHEHVEDPTIDGSRRCAEVSVSTLVVAQSSHGGWRMLVSPRANWVSSERFHYHVAPAGKFGPATPNDDVNDVWFSTEQTIFREFLEECCGRPELASDRADVELRLELFPEIQRLQTMIGDGEAVLRYSGLAMNLLNLQPEICTVLVVRRPDWLGSLRLNEEYADDVSGRLPAGIKVTRSIALDANLNPVGTGALLNRGNLVPVGAASIELGLSVARRVIDDWATEHLGNRDKPASPVV